MTTTEERMHAIHDSIVDLASDIWVDRCELIEEYGDDAECEYYDAMLDELDDAKDSILRAIRFAERGL